jgi:membrane fusion protein (multidrug efflux system)
LRVRFINQYPWKKKYLTKKYLVLCLFLSLALCYLWFSFGNKTPPLPKPVKLVDAKILKPETIEQTITLIGTIRPKHSTILVSKRSGLLDIMMFSGQSVKKGDLIAKIANPDIEKNVQLSEAAEALAKHQYQRFSELKKTGFVSSREIDEKKQSWIDAQKELTRTQNELNDLRFYVPFNGIIGAYKLREGTQVNEASPIVTIYDPSSLIVEIDIPCTNLPPIGANQTVYVFNKPYHLSHLQKMIDDETHMCPADIDIQCERCLIGSTVPVRLLVKRKQNTLVIPETAIFLKNGSSYVYKITNNKTELTAITTGLQQKKNIEVISGLKAGDQVVSKSPERLYPGLDVAVYQPADDKQKG